MSVDEAMFVTVAGIGAPSQVLAVTMFHILYNAGVYKALKVELAFSFSDDQAADNWSNLGRLLNLSLTSGPTSSLLPTRYAAERSNIEGSWLFKYGHIITYYRYISLHCGPPNGDNDECALPHFGWTSMHTQVLPPVDATGQDQYRHQEVNITQHIFRNLTSLSQGIRLLEYRLSTPKIEASAT